MPWSDEDRKAAEAVKVLKEYCEKRGFDGCIFCIIEDVCDGCLLAAHERVPRFWRIPEEGDRDE